MSETGGTPKDFPTLSTGMTSDFSLAWKRPAHFRCFLRFLLRVPWDLSPHSLARSSPEAPRAWHIHEKQFTSSRTRDIRLRSTPPVVGILWLVPCVPFVSSLHPSPFSLPDNQFTHVHHIFPGTHVEPQGYSRLSSVPRSFSTNLFRMLQHTSLSSVLSILHT